MNSKYGAESTHCCRLGRPRLFEQLPDNRLGAFEERQLALAELGMLVDAELDDEVGARRANHIDIGAVESGERFLGGAMLRVGHPAARLHLIRVEAPELQLLLEQRAAHVERIVQLARAIVAEHLREHAWVPIKEVLVGDGVVVDERLGEARQPRRRYLLQDVLQG